MCAIRHPVLLLCLGALVGGTVACSRAIPKDQVNVITLADWMMDPDLPARLNVPGAQMISSFDPTGGNDDAHPSLGCDQEGWTVLADLAGPGFVSRFWMTGPRDGSQRIRFFIDGESKARIDTTVGELCGGMDPFLPPLAAYENYAWYSYVPIPYAKSLLVKTAPFDEEDSHRRLYYQLNYHSMTGSTIQVESMSEVLGSREKEKLAEVRKVWGGVPVQSQGLQVDKHLVKLDVNDVCELPSWKGPAVFREMRVELDPERKLTPLQREYALRNLVLQLFWNGKKKSSVQVPLGDFFGMPTYPVAFRSLGFGLQDGQLYNRLPMPFSMEACMVLENRSSTPIELAFEVDVQKGRSAGLGYLHAAWAETDDDSLGELHSVADFYGEGKFVGCLLHMWSDDMSWLMLEGDEKIVVDKNTAGNLWHGTGLEDYFNGGWYYQNPLCRPQHGITMRVPFRTSQYRWHRLDAPTFSSSCSMTFERGPQNSSKGIMESVAFAYLAKPQPVPDVPMRDRTQRVIRDDDKKKIMMDLVGLERLGDMVGAQQHLQSCLEFWPDHEDGDLLRVRDAAYTAELQGFDIAKPNLMKLAESENRQAQEQARLLRDFYASDENGLLGLYCSTPTTAFLDGKAVGMGGNTESVLVYPVKVRPGQHVLGLEAKDKVMPLWVQASLRVHKETVGSTPEWRWMRQPMNERWKMLDFNDTGWPRVGGLGTPGPPIAPFFSLRPNGFVGMQSEAVGIWVPGPEGKAEGPFAFRATFCVRASGSSLKAR